MFYYLVSIMEPKNVEDALDDHFWILAMQEELEEFERNEVMVLVQRPPEINVIGTKCIFKNKSVKKEISPGTRHDLLHKDILRLKE